MPFSTKEMQIPSNSDSDFSLPTFEFISLYLQPKKEEFEKLIGKVLNGNCKKLISIFIEHKKIFKSQRVFLKILKKIFSLFPRIFGL